MANPAIVISNNITQGALENLNYAINLNFVLWTLLQLSTNFIKMSRRITEKKNEGGGLVNFLFGLNCWVYYDLLLIPYITLNMILVLRGTVSFYNLAIFGVFLLVGIFEKMANFNFRVIKELFGAK